MCATAFFSFLLQAASLAAYYSKARGSANVPVDYVQVRHLRKPNGAKPGFVIYEGQKTIILQIIFPNWDLSPISSNKGFWFA